MKSQRKPSRKRPSWLDQIDAIAEKYEDEILKDLGKGWPDDYRPPIRFNPNGCMAPAPNQTTIRRVK